MAKPIKYTVSDGKLVLTLEVCEEGGYFITMPLNPDVLTEADSLEEAFEMARDVISLFEDDRREEQKKLSSKNGSTRKRKRQPAG